jgi:glycosyltransferase involved in cell wall biosynthesis
VWIVVPSYNEGRRLESTVRGLLANRYTVVVIDDGSDEPPGDSVRQLPVWMLTHPINCGQGAAIQTGIDFAIAHGAEYVVTFDADGQHCVEEIVDLLAPLESGEADVALGSRFLGATHNMPATRWWMLKLAIVFTWFFSRIRVTDTHNGFRALTRGAAEKIRITQDRMAHASEILDLIRESKLRFKEVPVTITYFDDTLAKGQSSWNSLRIVGQLLLGRIVR